MRHTTNAEWGVQDPQASPTGHGLNQPATSPRVPKSREWFDLEVMMHCPDFPRTDYRRALHLFREFATGFAALASIPASVVLWGSARCKPEDPFYRAAVETSRLLARAGFGVITGVAMSTACALSRTNNNGDVLAYSRKTVFWKEQRRAHVID